MLNCHDATFLLSKGRDRKLTFSERMKLQLHTGMCRGCAEFGRQLPRLSAAAQALAGSNDPSGA